MFSFPIAVIAFSLSLSVAFHWKEGGKEKTNKDGALQSLKKLCKKSFALDELLLQKLLVVV